MIQEDTSESSVEQVFNILVMGILFVGICLEHYGGSLFGLFVCLFVLKLSMALQHRQI